MKDSTQKAKEFISAEMYAQWDEETKQIDYFTCIPDPEGDYAFKDVGKGILDELTFVESIKKNSLSSESKDEKLFITIIDAARAVLSMEFLAGFTAKNAEALQRRIMRMKPDDSQMIEAEGNRKLYPVDILISCFINDKQLGLDERKIALAIKDAGKTKEQLGLTKA